MNHDIQEFKMLIPENNFEGGIKAYNLFVNGKLCAIVKTKHEATQLVKEINAESDGLDSFKITRCTFIGKDLPIFID